MKDTSYKPNGQQKQTAEQLNIWYSPTTGLWMTCAWLPSELDHYFTREKVYRKDRHAHTTFQVAVQFVADNYVGGTK
jgi:hypothetical protein